MILAEIQKILDAGTYTQIDLKDVQVETICGADLLSDVLAFTKEKTLLLTGLVNLQVLRTAEMLDLVGVVFVRGKVPNEEMIKFAIENKIPLLCTKRCMYEACGLLFSAGIAGSSTRNY
ncbi:MAG: hypothetical protein PHI90_01240 [Clostridia bacterium]|nr:hypothetical protein [Clostridia bacterium]MDD4047449.1 hypothetical protein [Clostridia bacterium]